MLKKSVIISLLICVLLTASSCSSLLKTNAHEYMSLDTQTRIELATSKYSEFAKNPSKEYEVMISLKNIPYTEIPTLFEEQNNIISLFHYYEFEGDRVYGGYNDCEDKDIEKIVFEYYNSVYNMISGSIENYTPSQTNDALEKESSEKNLRLLIMQREAMDRDEFSIYGIRLVMQGEDINAILNSEYIVAVEILNFDNNNAISPILE